MDINTLRMNRQNAEKDLSMVNVVYKKKETKTARPGKTSVL